MQYCYVIIFAFGSCNSDPGKHTFVGIEEIASIEIPIDDQTKSRSTALSSFIEGEKEYLTYLNEYRRSIIFFDLATNQKSFEVYLSIEGPNGVGEPKGFFAKTMDSIYITSSNRKGLYLVNKNGTIINKYDYSKTGDDYYTEVTFYSRSIVNTPLVIDNENLFLTNAPGGLIPALPDDYLEKIPLALKINILSEEVQSLGVGLYPKDYWAEFRYSPYFSRVFDGERFVYVWWYSDSLYYTEDHISVKSVKLESDYFTKFTPRPRQFDDIIELERYILENPRYDNVVYDKFRDLYYVFAYIGVETDTNTDVIQLTRNKSDFTILIFNKYFDKLGEHKLEHNKFLVNNYFVGSKGLYISENNEFNPDFDENKLKFTLFQPRFAD